MSGTFSDSVVRQCVSIPNEILLEQVRLAIKDGHTATINVKGYSMRPFLENNADKVILKACTDPQVGEAVLAEVAPKKYVLHRVIMRDGDRLTLMGDGNLKGTEHCKVSDVIGVVSFYIHRGKKIPADQPSLKRRIAWWGRLRPVRRYLLFVYKVQLKLREKLSL